MSQPTGEGKPVPTPSKANLTYHWWFDRHQTGLPNSSPPYRTVYANCPSGTSPGDSPTSSPLSSSPPSFSFQPTEQKANTNPSRVRRDSLKNMVHLNDFATD